MAGFGTFKSRVRSAAAFSIALSSAIRTLAGFAIKAAALGPATARETGGGLQHRLVLGEPRPCRLRHQSGGIGPVNRVIKSGGSGHGKRHYQHIVARPRQTSAAPKVPSP